MKYAELRDSLENVRKTSKRLIAEATSENDFDAVASIARIAERADQIIAEFFAQRPRTSGESASRTQDGLQKELTVVGRARQLRPNPPSKNDRGKYPTFLREGDELVKLGKSRSSPRTYEHRAPKDVVDSVVQSIIQVGKTGKRFRVSDVVQQLDGGLTNDSGPSYRVYAALAWLKWCGLIVQHGRQGYSLTNPKRFHDLAASAWNQLKTR